jgi:hypothetical protein
VHGAYRRGRLAERLIAARCQVGLLPSIVPESFSLTLSELLACGLPVITSNLGAQRERVAAPGLGWSFDPAQPAELAALLEGLLAEPARIARCMERVAARPHHDERSMLDAHVALWRELSARGRRREPDPDLRAAARRTWALAAARPRNPALVVAGRGIEAIRRSEWYRDLSLRGLVPERWRARVQDWIAGALREKNGD